MVHARRIISPEGRALSELRTPLTSGELAAVEFFDRTLAPDWEIYVQPHMNGLRPDLVVLHPANGLGVFEVKDWSLRGGRYEYRGPSGAVSQPWGSDYAGNWFRCADDPIGKVLRYKSEILELYCPHLGQQLSRNPGAAAGVTAGVIFAQATTKEVQALVRQAVEARGLGGPKATYHTFVGGDALQADRLSEVFPWAASGRASKWMSVETAEDLRYWLREPDHAVQQRDPLPMNSRQRELATTRTPSGYRRIRGPAGSGKSLALAARAAQLSAEGKDVLVISFNITLLHYLRDLAVRYPHPKSSIVDRITWLHFHGWCKRTCEEADREQEYNALWAGYYEAEADADRENSLEMDGLLETGLPALARTAIESGTGSVSTYDAVLCDEGQDLNLEWWNLLRSVVRPGGEMVLAADKTQDLYGQAAKWTEGRLEDAGFRGGRWFDLEGSYRFPSRFVPYLRDFVQQYVGEVGASLPTAVQSELLEPLYLEWIQVRREELEQQAVENIASLPSRVGTEPARAPKWSDVAIVVPTHRIGLRVAELLEQRKGIELCHVFGADHRAKQWRKSAFWMGDPRVKAATLHSFKGWEAPCLVVVIDAARKADLARIYVALSRLRRSISGSALIVICSATELLEYGQRWPIFRDARAEPAPCVVRPPGPATPRGDEGERS